VLVTRAKHCLETGNGKDAPDICLCSPGVTIDTVGSAQVKTLLGLKRGSVSVETDAHRGQCLKRTNGIFLAHPLQGAVFTVLANPRGFSLCYATRMRPSSGDVPSGSLLIQQAKFSNALTWTEKNVLLLASVLLHEQPDQYVLPSYGSAFCSEVLGIGATSVVYSLSFGNVVMKVARSVDHNVEVEAEAECLNALYTRSGCEPTLKLIPRVVKVIPPSGERPLAGVVLHPICEPFGTVARNSSGLIFGENNCMELLAAVSLAHSCQLVHRDVRPANVMSHNDSVVLLDWGFCVRADTSCDIAGTIRCASPGVRQAWDRRHQYEYSYLDDLYSCVYTCVLFRNPPLWRSLCTSVGPTEAVHGSTVDKFWLEIASANPKFCDLLAHLGSLSSTKLTRENYARIAGMVCDLPIMNIPDTPVGPPYHILVRHSLHSKCVVIFLVQAALSPVRRMPFLSPYYPTTRTLTVPRNDDSEPEEDAEGVTLFRTLSFGDDPATESAVAVAGACVDLVEKEEEEEDVKEPDK
jgi:hypothetical protein